MNTPATALLRLMEESLSKIFTPCHFRKYLLASQALCRYSERNKILILSHCPQATHVEEFDAWRRQGRHVKRGEKGIPVLAPRIIKTKKMIAAPGFAGNTSSDADDTSHKTAVVTESLKFTVLHVFDISQTERVESAENQNERNYPKVGILFDALKALTPCSVHFVSLGEGEKGYCDEQARRIILPLGLSDCQAILQLLRQIVQSNLPTEGMLPPSYYRVLEEGVSFVLAHELGLPILPFSFDCLPAVVVCLQAGGQLRLLCRIQETASALLEKVQLKLKEIQCQDEQKEEKQNSLQVRLQRAEQEAANRAKERVAQIETKGVF